MLKLPKVSDLIRALSNEGVRVEKLPGYLVGPRGEVVTNHLVRDDPDNSEREMISSALPDTEHIGWDEASRFCRQVGLDIDQVKGLGFKPPSWWLLTAPN